MLGSFWFRIRDGIWLSGRRKATIKNHLSRIIGFLMAAPRKGAVRMADIPPSILLKLNKGEIEALTLAEVLAVDFVKLLRHSFPDLDPALIKKMRETELGWLGRTKLAGELLYEGYGAK